MGFQVKTIERAPPLGSWLRREREERGWTLEKASRETKIQKKYLSLIEDEQFEALPDGLVKRNFVRGYVKTMGGGPELLGEAERIVSRFNTDTRVALHPPIGLRWAITSEHLKLGGLILAALGIAIYLAVQVNALVAPPLLIISAPFDGSVTNIPTITVEGSTDNKAVVHVNDKEVTKDAQGFFRGTTDLRRGTNFIKIESKRKHSRPRVEYRTVLFE